eukprot:TRINITY_DN75204_c0_g1_i1.p1 TRINITY_DN75204_c0_g1~~TRINITY_DN75204_c0_g1_i1.p1  ORF type:complete len:175 (-),score=16.81 TRINITY_DN75204_c0_g1_i1:183-707(-)
MLHVVVLALLSVSCYSTATVGNKNEFAFIVTAYAHPGGWLVGTTKAQTLKTDVDAAGDVSLSTAGVSGGGSITWMSQLIPGTRFGGHWEEQGNITFGDAGDSISFHCVGGCGSLWNARNTMPTIPYTFGGISYEIFEGSGKYKGAIGTMVDMFSAFHNSTKQVEIRVWGFFFLP